MIRASSVLKGSQCISLAMDEANSRLGSLSLKATEWRPSSMSANIDRHNDNDANSDLNAETVKEFIPGKGWTISAAVETTIEEPGEAHGGYDASLLRYVFVLVNAQ